MDRAIAIMPVLERFLSQDRDDRTEIEAGYARLAEILDMKIAADKDLMSKECKS